MRSSASSASKVTSIVSSNHSLFSESSFPDSTKANSTKSSRDSLVVEARGLRRSLRSSVSRNRELDVEVEKENIASKPAPVDSSTLNQTSPTDLEQVGKTGVRSARGRFTRSSNML